MRRPRKHKNMNFEKILQNVIDAFYFIIFLVARVVFLVWPRGDLVDTLRMRSWVKNRMHD
jgi:hypothetical protein